MAAQGSRWWSKRPAAPARSPYPHDAGTRTETADIRPTARGYSITPHSHGGWILERLDIQSDARLAPEQFPADPVRDPDGEIAYRRAREAADFWRTRSPFVDRRVDHERRRVITRLRLAGANADFCIAGRGVAAELAAAIDAVVDLVRSLPPGTAPDDGPGVYGSEVAP